MPVSDERQDLLKLYQLVLESEERFLNRAETRARFYQILVSALLAAPLVALARLYGNELKPHIIFTLQAFALVASLIAVLAVPGIYRVYRRSVWEAHKRVKLEVLLGLTPISKEEERWPKGLVENEGKSSAIVNRHNLGRQLNLENLLDETKMHCRSWKGVFGWIAATFYILATLGCGIAILVAWMTPQCSTDGISIFSPIILLLIAGYTWYWSIVRDPVSTTFAIEDGESESNKNGRNQ